MDKTDTGQDFGSVGFKFDYQVHIQKQWSSNSTLRSNNGV